MEPEFPESKIEQMFCCVGGDSLAPGFWLNQVPDLAFFGASQDDHAAKPNHITWRAIRNCSDDGCPGIRRGSDGDSTSDSRRNFSLSSREHKGNSMWRTTSILEVRAWTASISPDSRVRSPIIAKSLSRVYGVAARQPHPIQPGCPTVKIQPECDEAMISRTIKYLSKDEIEFRLYQMIRRGPTPATRRSPKRERAPDPSEGTSAVVGGSGYRRSIESRSRFARCASP